MSRTRLPLPARPVAVLAVAAGLLGLLAAPPGDPSPRTAPVAATAENTATVFYWTKTKNWTAYHLHDAPDGGSWTTVPGVAMEPACTDWVKKTVSLGTAAGLQATFNNGNGTWDNNGGSDYTIGTGVSTVRNGW